MRILIIGGTGFVGSNLTATLAALPVQLYLVSRRAVSIENAVSLPADITSELELKEVFTMVRPDVVINLVAIIRGQSSRFDQLIRGGNKIVVKLAEEFKVKKYIYISALGANVLGSTAYQRAKGRAEQDIISSKLNWTIFRPSLIFGKGAGFTGELIKGSKYLPFWPVIGNGNFQFQPVSVDTLSTCIAQAIEKASTNMKLYDVVGPETLSLKQIMDRLRNSLNSRKPLLRIPLQLAKILALAGDFGLPSPLTTDQLVMLQQGSTGDATGLKQDFSFSEVIFRSPSKLF